MPSDDSSEPLLADENDPEDPHAKPLDEHQTAISLIGLLVTPELRKPLIIVCFSMLCQQLSGMGVQFLYIETWSNRSIIGVNAGTQHIVTTPLTALNIDFQYCIIVTIFWQRLCPMLDPSSHSVSPL